MKHGLRILAILWSVLAVSLCWAGPEHHHAWQTDAYPPSPETPHLDSVSRPASTTGSLRVTIETQRSTTPKRSTMSGTRCELWVEETLLAVLSGTEAGVIPTRHGRTFSFAPLTLPTGYHHLIVRVFAEGPISRDLKYKERVYQVGIHAGTETVLRERIHFRVW